jgi:tetratricopeptide (TPR) repeat protein
MSLGRSAAVILLALAAPAALAAGGSTSPPDRPVDPDYAAAEKAIAAKDWPEAIRLLKQAMAREESNADVHNLLGFAERNQGNLDAAFAHYERALQLNPKHRGAHEYVGEAYLLAGNLPKAEEHLAALDKLCFFSCEEYRDLKKSIAEYKRRHASAAP